MNRTLLTTLAALALSSCATTAAPPAADWSGFTRATIEKWLAIDPSFAVYQGAHQFDGKLPDWSAEGIKARADFMRGVIGDAQAFDKLTGAEAFERDYLIQVAKGELFWLEDAREPFRSPDYYTGGLDPNVYISREYADKSTRMKALIAFFEGVPAAARQIRANLATPMPASFVKFGIAGFAGFAEYYRGDARAAFADVADPALQTRLRDSSEAAAVAMDGLAAWLRAEQPRATQDFALGAERFSRMLAATEGVTASLDELEAAGRADLARNRAALVEACSRFAPGQSVPACFARMNANKPVGGPVATATRQVPELVTFVRANDLVSIPGTEQALVRESPPYNRQNSAYIDPPGPFEKGIPSVYYISPPDPAWPQDKQDAFVPGTKDLLFTTVHEVMPGHFLQFLHSNRSPSLIGRLFVGYAFAEGWAHYSEEMMLEAGLGGGDPETQIGQLSNALLRNCRYLSAIGLHARGMTQEQSKALFREQCYQDDGTAEQQAARGTYDPAYLNYTLGKLMIRRLRADWTATRGGRQAWKAFHDRLLSYGGPPLPLARRAMMNEPAPRALF